MDHLHEVIDSQAMFEAWAQSHGGFPLFKHEKHLCEKELVYPATYFNYVTEMAWRTWANKPNTTPNTAQKPIAWMVSAEHAGSNYLDRYIYWEDNEMLKGHRQAGHAIVVLYAGPDVPKQQK